MTDQATKDTAAKKRIITHMNADHQDSLIRYLEHYCNLSSFAARNARLTDITLDGMTIASSGTKLHDVPIKPPMTAWSEARPRVVDMDAEAAEGLGRSNVTVKRYKEPRGFMTVVMVACLLTYVAFSRRSNFTAGSMLYDMLLWYVPRFSNFCWKVQPLVIYPMVVVHAGRAIYMERSRLRKHTVKMFCGIWWLWMVSTFVEGQGAFMRFDEAVRDEEERKAKAKHQ